MPDSLEARRLLEMIYQNRVDGPLQVLIRSFTGEHFWLSVPMAVVAGGQLIRGQLSRPEDFAQHLEKSIEKIVSRTNFTNEAGKSASSEEELNGWRQGLIDGLKGRFTSRVARERQLDQRAETALEKEWSPLDPNKQYDIDDLPEGLVKEAIAYRAPEAAFVLDNAEIFAGGRWIAVGPVRVLVRQIAAWWLLNLDATTVEEAEQSANTIR
jgi:hypothetical protein